MNTQWNAMRIGQIVSRFPKAAELFKARKIDYCCGGRRALGEVLAELGGGERELYDALDGLAARDTHPGAAEGFLKMAPADLSAYIQERHHAYLREALPETGELFSAVLKAHGAKQPGLLRAHGLFGRLRTELEQHLVKEEVFLFPLLEGGKTPEAEKLSAEIVSEHEAAGAMLKELRAAMDDYTAPQDACRGYRLLLDSLLEMEDDLFQHIHLENNILLKHILQEGGDGVD